MKKSPPQTTPEQRRAQWLKGLLDLFVLAQLQEGEAYGYELAKGLESKGLGEIKGGTLYPLLNRLERDGLVTTVWRSSDQGPDRKYYRIATPGRRALDETGPAWVDFAALAKSILSNSIQEST